MVTVLFLALSAVAGDPHSTSGEHLTSGEEPPACPPGHPAIADGSPAARFGPVLETMNSGGYTYARIDTGDGEVWIAGPERQIAVGDQIATSEGALMANFQSRTLGRTFERLWLVTEVAVLQGSGGAHAAPEAVASAQIPPLVGGFTVERVLTTPADLEGREIVVRARVARVSEGILGLNWLHVQDGSGRAATGTHDLVVTTLGIAAVGDLVDVRGTVARNRDFGSGYKYAVILEGAVLTPAAN